MMSSALGSDQIGIHAVGPRTPGVRGYAWKIVNYLFWYQLKMFLMEARQRRGVIRTVLVIGVLQIGQSPKLLLLYDCSFHAHHSHITQ